MTSKRPDLDALRKDTIEVLTDPEERERVLRDLDALEKMMAESDRRDAALARTAHAYKAASRARLAVILVLCTLIALVVAGIWLPQVLDRGLMTSPDGPVTANDAPIHYWVSVGAAVVSVVGCAFAAVFAFFALVRYPKHPFRRAAAASSDLASIPVDALAEADVYVAYGRTEQAIEVLEEALTREPQRKDLAQRLEALRKGS